MRFLRTCFRTYLVTASLATVTWSGCTQEDAKLSAETPVNPTANGEPCVYLSYEGRAKITRVIQTTVSREQSEVLGGPGYEGYEVWFRFESSQALPENANEIGLSEEQPFLLANGWYVGPKYLEKYGVEPGSVFSCILKLIETGVCTPVVFEFETPDPRDYFESRS